MSKIELNVTDHNVTVANLAYLTSGSVNVDELESVFDSSWNDMLKIALFYRTDKIINKPVVMINNSCLLPNEVLSEPGDIYVAIVGVTASSVNTTNSLRFNVEKGSYEVQVESDPKIYDQIIVLASELQKNVNQLHNDLSNYAKKDEIANVLNPKPGSFTYSQLQSMTTGYNVGDCVWCTDGDGNNPAGNYAWTGSVWSFRGTGDEGYTIIKRDFTSTTRNMVDKSNVRIGLAWNNATNSARAVLYVVVEPSTEYSITIDTSNFDDVYYIEKENVDSTTANANTKITSDTFTRTTHSATGVLGFQFNKENIALSDFVNIRIQVEKGPISTEYMQHRSAVDYVMRQSDPGYISVKMFGAKGDGVTDDTQAIQNAINYVKYLVTKANSISVNNTVIIPGGVYVVSDTIKVSPFVKIKTTGYVTILSSVQNKSIFWLNGETEDIQKYLSSTKAPWLSGLWIDGSSGLFIKGNTTDNALEIGSRTKPSSAIECIVARYKIANMTIQNCNVALLLNMANMYLPTFENMDIEVNKKCVKFGDGTVNYNAGECISFKKCIFASSDNAFYFDSANVDVSLIGCSIDFCDQVFYDNSKGYQSIMCIGGHIEGSNVKNTSESGIVCGEFKQSTIIIHSSSLTYSKNRNSVGESFKGRLVLDGIHERVPLFDNVAANKLFNNYNAGQISVKNIGIQEKYHIITAKQNCNYNCDFTEFADADFASFAWGITKKGFTINTYVNNGKCNVSLSDDSPFANGKSLLITPTIADRYYPYIESDYIDVKQNETYFCSPAFKASSGINNLNPVMSVIFYDANKNIVQDSTNMYLYRSNIDTDTWSFNGGSYFTVPARAKYAKVNFKVNCYPATLEDTLSFGGLFIEKIFN